MNVNYVCVALLAVLAVVIPNSCAPSRNAAPPFAGGAPAFMTYNVNPAEARRAGVCDASVAHDRNLGCAPKLVR